MGLLRQIEKEMKAFLDVKKGLRIIKRRIDESKEKKIKLSAELNKIESTPGDTVKKNLFKKMPKSQLINELSSQIDNLSKDDENYQKILGILYNVIHDNEFPKLILFKRWKFAHGTT